MKAVKPLILSIALFVVFFSCSGNNDAAEANEVDESVNIEAETESDQLYATVSIENGPGLICEFTYANCSALVNDEWGPNYEGIPGEFITFEVEAGEYYDMRCVDSASNEYFIWNVLVEEDGFRWLVESDERDNTFSANPHAYHTSKGDAAITIHLSPGFGAVRHIYCEQLNSPELANGADRLRGAMLYTNDEFTFHVPTGTGYRYSIQIENVSGEMASFYDIAIDENGIYLDVTTNI